MTLIRLLLKNHLRAVLQALGSDKLDQKASALKLLTAVTRFGLGGAKDLFQVFNFGFRPLAKIVNNRQRSEPKEPSIRTLYVQFVLSFLENEDPAFRMKVLKVAAFVGGIFKGVAQDPASLVASVLRVLDERVISDDKILRSTKLALVNFFALEHLAPLYGRTDEEEDSVGEGEEAVTVARLLHAFLLKACVTPGRGICFKDEGWYQGRSGAAAGKIYNPTLLRFLQVLRPSDDLLQQELAIEIMRNCPELVRLLDPPFFFLGPKVFILNSFLPFLFFLFWTGIGPQTMLHLSRGSH